jgi:hypothetical protein
MISMTWQLIKQGKTKKYGMAELTVIIESSLIDDSSWSSSQRTDTSGAGSANPVVSSNI